MPRGRRSRSAGVDAAVDRSDRARHLDAGQHLSRRRAVTVQAGLGITHGAAFDLQAVCSGFVYALATADGLLRTGAYKRALVIGAETFSRILDWNDRTTCVLFGDGAGAVVLEAQQQPGDARGPRHPDDASALRRPSQGQALCRRRAVLDADGRPPAHGRPRGVQARRGDDHRRDRGRLRGHRLYGGRHRLVRAAPGQQAHHRRLAPTSSASRRKRWSPPSTRTATPRRPRSRWRWTSRVDDGRIKKGDLVLLEAMGGGFTWGRAVAGRAGEIERHRATLLADTARIDHR